MDIPKFNFYLMKLIADIFIIQFSFLGKDSNFDKFIKILKKRD
jgi:hypothetical protein